MRRVLLVLAVAAAAVLTTLVGAGPVATAAVGATWPVTDRLGRDGLAAAADCPTAGECWAIEAGRLLSTTDLGAHWADREALVPPAARSLDDLTCPAAGQCRLTARTAGGAALIVVDGARALLRPIPGGTRDLRLTCPSTTACVATDGSTVFRTADAGRTWAASALPRRMVLPAISCGAASTTCWAVGRGPGATGRALLQRSLDGGATWRVRPDPAFLDVDASFLDVDCSTAARCRVVGGSGSALVMTTADGGATWKRNPLPGGLGVLRAVSCAAPTACRAIGADGDQQRGSVSTLDGITWTADPRSAGSLTPAVDIACAATTRCVVVMSGRQLRAVAPDDRWVEGALPAALERARDVDCPTVAVCIGIGADLVRRAAVVRGVPGAFTTTAMPVAVGRPDAVDCVTATVCRVLSSDDSGGGLVAGAWRTADGGATWSAGSFSPTLQAYGVALSCPTSTVCLGLTGDRITNAPGVVRTIDGGQTWTRIPVPVGTWDLSDVACVSAASCVVVGLTPSAAVAWRTTDLGSSFTAAVLATDDAARFPSVACWASTCLAAGSTAGGSVVARSTDRGRTWALAAVPVTRADTIACAANGRCAVGGFGQRRPAVSTDGGLTWRSDQVAPGYAAEVLGCRSDQCFTLSSPFEGGPVALAEP